MYAFKVSRQDGLGTKNLIVSAIAVIYVIYCFIAVGFIFLAASFILYAIGMFFYYKTKKDNNKEITKGEWIAMIGIFALGVVMAILLGTGVITF